ncbi:MAG: prephenate dehydrogenase, partial [Salinirussus sp.]
MRALVVGAGAMGRWVGTVLRSAAIDVDLAVADTDSEVARNAANDLDAVVIDDPTDASVDLVCIAVPIPAARTTIET